MRVQQVRMPVTEAESWTVLDDGCRPQPAIEQLPVVSGRHRALAQHGARLRDELEAVVRVSRPGRVRMGRGRRGRRGPLRVVVAGSGRKRDRVGKRSRVALGGHGEPSPRRGLRLLRAQGSLWRRCRSRPGRLAAGEQGLLQAVPPPREQGKADAHEADQARRCLAARRAPSTRNRWLLSSPPASDCATGS